MKVAGARFVRGAAGPGDFPHDLPEIAFWGRSNVGKSSLLNCLCGRRKLATTSRTPGRTREVNYYRIDQGVYFVDLPGLGYARVGKDLRGAMVRRLEGYFANNSRIRLVFYLVDLRVPRSPVDVHALQWLGQFEVPVQVLVTKADKVKPSQLQNAIQRVHWGLELPVPPIACSAPRGTGREAVLRRIREELHPRDLPSSPGRFPQT